MDKRITSAKISPAALAALQAIAQHTGELRYRALERIILAEWKRLQRQPKE